MSTRKPTIRINVNPTNPGQFFACCGLLELADRSFHGAEGWFEDRAFLIACDGSYQLLHTQLAGADISSSLSDDQLKRLGTLLSANKSNLTPEETAEKQELKDRWQNERLHISAPFHIGLDWWSDDRAGGTRFKTWAAKQLVVTIARQIQAPLKTPEWSEISGDDCLTRSATTDALPFYFDSDLSAMGMARDAGFSLDTLGLKMPFRPLLELAAFVGLQRFRPAQLSNDGLFQFSLWSIPLQPSVASAAASGTLGLQGSAQYEFRILKRSDYMKAFLPSQPHQGDMP